MSYKVVILKEAKADFKESFDWYKKINPALSKRFTVSFKGALKIIQQNPFQFQIRYDDVRVILLKTFPYLLHFTVENEKIVIKAVFHTSRDSKNWSKRSSL